MDGERFDLLSRSLALLRSRRRFMPLLAGAPAAGALFARRADTDGKGKRHHARIGAERKKKKKHKKTCKLQPVSVTCNGKCGAVLNNCKKSVDCGPCPCNPPCAECEVCDGQTVTCVPDPAAVGDSCGDSGQICQANGSCACSGESCGLCRTCQGGDCQPDPEQTGCGNGKLCCGDPTICVDIKNDAANCGGCGVACPAGHVCRKAACEVCVCPGVDGCFATVQGAVDVALDDDVVRICEGSFIGGSGALSVLDNRRLTVIGAGSGLNPNSNTLLDTNNPPGRIVHIGAAATVALRDLRIMDGNVIGDGGGILNEGTLTLRDCAVSNNQASDDGGGIANAAGATLTLIDCLITLNESGDTGAGIYNEGTLVSNGATVISENTAASGGGGLANVLAGTTELNNTSTISDNDAQDGAGVFNNGSIVLNNDSSIADNTASRFGGGILSDVGGDVELNNSSSISGNTASQGGGILNQSGTVTLNNSSRIHDNTVTGDGGGIDNSGVVVMNDNSAVNLNNAVGDGGGIRNTIGSSVTLNDTSSIDHNEAGDTGGGIFNQGTVNASPGSSIANNSPDQCVDDGPGSGCV